VAPTLSAQHAADELLDIGDYLTKLLVRTRLGPTVAVHEAQSAAALEVMSRFAVSPRWLVYLPPTMSPPATSQDPDFLEHPREAFDYFAEAGAPVVVAEEKHMGSRAVVVVCRSEATAAKRFGVATGETGVITTRTGRSFFNDAATTEALLARVRGAMEETGFWARHGSDWAVLDCELMPWSAKALSLIREQYAATGAAARLGLRAAEAALAGAVASGADAGGLASRMTERRERAEKYVDAYRRYCWEVRSLDDYRLAPFHLLATEGAVHMDKPHDWHMDELARLAATGDAVLMATPWRKVDLGSAKDRDAATGWWLERTQAGGEGMVVKPLAFVERGPKGLVQPAVKCRGREYLRIIYGPEYDAPENLARLKSRGLGHKRALASREFALGHEALHRFVDREPLRRVHECVFAVLALESEPVDPRL
jgi:protein phosphatase